MIKYLFLISKYSLTGIKGTVWLILISFPAQCVSVFDACELNCLLYIQSTDMSILIDWI
jgi:hypothetical protein